MPDKGARPRDGSPRGHLAPHEILQVAPYATRPVIEAAYLALMTTASDADSDGLTTAARMMLEPLSVPCSAGFEKMFLGRLLSHGDRTAIGYVDLPDGRSVPVYRLDGSPRLRLGDRPLSPATARKLFSAGRVRNLLVHTVPKSPLE